MANQYTGSLEHKAQERFGCSAFQLLTQFAEQGLSYEEAEDQVGIADCTIRKWARRYGIRLVCSEQKKQELERRRQCLFKARHINEYNFLSRAWCCGSIQAEDIKKVA